MATPKNSAAIWPTWQRLYPRYGAIARELVEWPSCPELVQPLDSPPAEVILETGKWFAEIVRRIEVEHPRQFAQTSALMTGGALKVRIGRAKPGSTAATAGAAPANKPRTAKFPPSPATTGAGVAEPKPGRPK